TSRTRVHADAWSSRRVPVDRVPAIRDARLAMLPTIREPEATVEWPDPHAAAAAIAMLTLYAGANRFAPPAMRSPSARPGAESSRLNLEELGARDHDMVVVESLHLPVSRF